MINDFDINILMVSKETMTARLFTFLWGRDKIDRRIRPEESQDSPEGAKMTQISLNLLRPVDLSHHHNRQWVEEPSFPQMGAITVRGAKQSSKGSAFLSWKSVSQNTPISAVICSL